MRLAWSVAIAVFVGGGAGDAAAGRLVRRLGSDDGLPVTSIASLAEDRRGFLWIGTDGGLVRHDGAEPVSVAGDALRGVIAQLAPAGDGVLAIQAGDVYRVGDRTASRLAGVTDARAVAQDAGGRAWVAPWRGPLVVEDRAGWRPVGLDDVWALAVDGDEVIAATRDAVWRIGAAGVAPLGRVPDVNGAIVDLDVDGGRVLAMVSSGRVVELAGGAVREVVRRGGRGIAVEARGDDVWAAFDTVVTVAHRDGSSEDFRAADGFVSGGPMVVDREGSVWIGTFDGLLQLPEPRTIALGAVEGLPSSHTRSLLRDAGGVWVVTWQGLGFVDDRPIPTARAEPGAPHANQPLCRDRHGRLWTRGGVAAIAVRDAGGWSARPSPGAYLGCTVDAAGTAYLSTARHLWRAEADGALAELPAPPLAGALHVHLVDGDGALWVSADGRLCHATPPGFAWACVDSGGQQVTDLLEVAPGRLWATTHDRGLRAGGAGGFTAIDTGATLPATTLLGLAPGRDGTAWVLGHGAIVRARAVDDRLDVVERLGAWNGVATDGAQDLIEDPDGTIWLTSSIGVVRVPAAARGGPPAPPAIYLVSSTAGGAIVPPVARYQLDHGASLELGFVAPALRAPASRRYRVRIGGGAWSAPTRAGGLRLAGLDAGAHRVEIAASLDGVTWSAPLRVDVAVAAPWYRRWWALAAAALLLVGLGWGAHRLRQELDRRLLRQRTRIAMDLHDEMGAGLASIGLLASVAASDTLPTDERQAVVAQIGSQSQDLGSSLADIVWTLRTGSDTLEAFADHLVACARRLVVGPTPRLAFAFPQPMPRVELSLPLRRNLQLLAMEAIHNAVKHAGARTIVLAIATAGRRYRLSITDDGRGLGPPRAGGLGLVSMRRRAAEIGAAIAWSVPDGGGTAVTVTFHPRARDRRVERRLFRRDGAG